MKKLYLKDAIKFALNAFSSNINIFVIYGAASVLLLSLVFSASFFLLPSDLVSAFTTGNSLLMAKVLPTLGFSYSYILLAFVYLAYFIIAMSLYLGLAKVALRIIDGGRADKNDLLFGFKKIGSYIAAFLFCTLQFFVIALTVMIVSKLILSKILPVQYYTYAPIMLYAILSAAWLVITGIPFLFLSLSVVDKKVGFMGHIKNGFAVVKGVRFYLLSLVVISAAIASIFNYFINLAIPTVISVTHVFNSFITAPIFLFILAFIYRRLEEQS